MPTPAEITEKFIKNRRSYTERKAVIDISLYLFSLALKDRSAAEALLKEPNRFLQVLSSCLSREKFLEFARANSKTLICKLADYAYLDDALKQEMLHAASTKPENKELNKILEIMRGLGSPVSQQGRTFLAGNHNKRVVEKNGQKGVAIGEQFVPIVTRNTRDFNQKICSAGASSEREIILLDPDDPVLKNAYWSLKKKLGPTSNPQEVLKVVKEMTRACLPLSSPDQLIKNHLDANRPVVSLSEFILKKQGVCRHHSLLNAYFLSRLVSDNLLHGEVIHHRQNFNKSAHTWNLFRNDKDGKVYSLDSLWDDLTCITDNPGAINRLYNQNVEAMIHGMHFANKSGEAKNKLPLHAIKKVAGFYNSPQMPNAFRANFKQETPASLQEKIEEIKAEIEMKTFKVGSFLLFKGGRLVTLTNGQEKRVPHRVYEIYEAIKQSDGNYVNCADNAALLWKEIQKHAADGKAKPRPKQHESTTRLYSDIVDYKHDNSAPINPLRP